MKKIKLSLLLAMFAAKAFAQVHTDANGNVGIGTTAPQAKLDVNGSAVINGPGATLTLKKNTTNIPGIVFQGANQIAAIEGGDDYMSAYIGGSRRFTILSNGNVGIGTNNPLQKFVVSNQDQDGFEVYLQQPTGVVGLQAYNRANSGYVGMQFDASKFVFTAGNVGIGTTTPTAKLSFNNVDNSIDADGLTWFSGSPLSYGIYRTPGSWTSPAFQQLKLSWDTGIILDPGTNYGKSYVDIQGAGLRVTSGNVGIGTTTPSEKLSVNGKIRAKEIKVETANWPDYVFAEGYEVGTLKELESYIKANKHLPDMPSAKEAEANGVELGEMNKLLLKKVEELTLYLIEKDKQIKQLENRMANLEKQKQ